jgi:hypothetical protein
LSAELIANRSDRRLPNLLGCKAREADGLMSGSRADFHHGPEPLWFLSEAGYMSATGFQIIDAVTLRTGLGPYMHPNFPGFISSQYGATGPGSRFA